MSGSEIPNVVLVKKKLSSHVKMTNASAKKSAALFRKSLILYGGIGLGCNALFFFFRLWLLPISPTTNEWYLIAFTELTLLLSGWTLIATATDLGTVADSSLDFFGIASATLVLSSFWVKGWWLLAGVPAYLIYQYGGFILGVLGLDKSGAVAPPNAAAGGGNLSADGKRATVTSGRKTAVRK